MLYLSFFIFSLCFFLIVVFDLIYLVMFCPNPPLSILLLACLTPLDSTFLFTCLHWARFFFRSLLSFLSVLSLLGLCLSTFFVSLDFVDLLISTTRLITDVDFTQFTPSWWILTLPHHSTSLKQPKYTHFTNFDDECFHASRGTSVERKSGNWDRRWWWI